ncbi:molybdenum cofactor biosynthesis protein MoaE [Gilvimarinus sp. DA14]|uniref:molybdenum cofactor biosynthesis protein MoaE n=1 Tax=Gilvimarinus sp. DA14 TaxID=2956798 RepID=UPI0020B7E389|nr:molybdenum cofactor biosynthesis protein MoaE [Gilvimarinus sp. DA14]UTF61157.1 molybdenum cofactor biosynthesis protein MoaE [Gilvimarinus sp. DA14]
MLFVSVQNEDFDLSGEYQALLAAAPEAGGVVQFVGRVRPDHAADPVVALELEHYPAMTQAALQALVEEACERWPLHSARVIHRVGRIAAGEQIVLVTVAAAHRDQAFQGARFLIDKLKTSAPFWKKEHRRSGAVAWVQAKAADDQIASGWD